MLTLPLPTLMCLQSSTAVLSVLGLACGPSIKAWRRKHAEWDIHHPLCHRNTRRHARTHAHTHQLTPVAFASSICFFKRSKGLAILDTKPLPGPGAGSVTSAPLPSGVASVTSSLLSTAFACFLARFFLFFRAALLSSSRRGAKQHQ